MNNNIQQVLLHINDRYENGTLLYKACVSLDIDLIEFLLNLGADPNIDMDILYEEKYHILSKILDLPNEPFQKVLLKFIDKKVDINQELDKSWNTMLHIACCKCDASKVLTLLNQNADVNRQNKNGETVLHTLIFSYIDDPSIYILGLLLIYGANINICNNKGQTLLHKLYSYMNFYRFVIQKITNIVLVNSTINPDFTIQDNEGKTILHMLCDNIMVCDIDSDDDDNIDNVYSSCEYTLSTICDILELL